MSDADVEAHGGEALMKRRPLSVTMFLYQPSRYIFELTGARAEIGPE